MFQVGDKVKVRSWTDFLNEFIPDDSSGFMADNYDGAGHHMYFNLYMKMFCDKEYEISEIFDEAIFLVGITEWTFCDAFLYPVKEV